MGVAVLLAYQWRENTAQARHIASVQEQLQRATPAVASQETAITEHEQQNMARLAEMRRRELAFEQLRTRQPTVEAAKLARGAAGNTSASANSFALNSPKSSRTTPTHSGPCGNGNNSWRIINRTSCGTSRLC